MEKGPDDITLAGGMVLTPESDFKEGIRPEQYILTSKIDDLFKPKLKGIPETPKERKAVNTDMEEENKEVFTPKVSRLVIFDIETYADQNMKDDYMEWKSGGKLGNRVDPKKIEDKKNESRGKFALSPLTGEVILGGFLTDDDKGKSITQIGLNGATEKMILTEVAERLYHYYSLNYKFISFGGKRFDLPYIYFRCLILGLNVNLPPLHILNYKYENETHCDLENVVPEGGLAEWGYRLGYATSYINDGGNIADYFFKKQYDVIRQKNAMDLKLTHTFFKLIENKL